jgi:hypothetical protein
MAIGYGLGIGLQGTPKDYVDIIRSRDAAAAKNAAAKAAREAKNLERAQEAFTRKLATTKVLAIHQKTVDDLTAQFYDAVDKEADNDTPNINEINRLATEIGNKMNELAVTKSNWERIGKDAIAYGLTAEEAGLLSFESDPAVWEETLKKSGSGLVGFDPTTRQVVINAQKGYKPVGQIFNEYTNEGANDNIYDYTKPVATSSRAGSKIEIFGVNPAVADAFAAQNLDNPFIDRDMFVEYRNKGKSLPQIGTPDYATAKATYLKDKFNELSKNFQLERETRPAGQYKTTIINTPAQKAVGAPSYDKQTNTYLGGIKTGVSDGYNVYGSFVSDLAASIPGIPYGAVSLDDHERVSGSLGTASTSTLYIVPVFKADTPSKILDKTGSPITFKKGEIVPVSMEDSQKNNLEYKMVGIGIVEPAAGSNATAISMQLPASSTIQAIKAKLSEQEKAAFERHIDDMNNTVNKLNKSISSGGSSSGTKTTAKSAAGSGM